MRFPSVSRHSGFTLIEVLIALAVIAIAFTALLQVNLRHIKTAEHLEARMIQSWIGQQAIAMIQLGLIPANTLHNTTQITTLFQQKWYWRAIQKPTQFATIQRIEIQLSAHATGPFLTTTTTYYLYPS